MAALSLGACFPAFGVPESSCWAGPWAQDCEKDYVLGWLLAGLSRLDSLADSGPRFRVPGFPYTPLVFLALVALMLFLLASRSPRQALLGVLVVLLGVPAFRLVRK